MTNKTLIEADKTTEGVGSYQGLSARCPQCGWVSRYAFSGGISKPARRVSSCVHLIGYLKSESGQHVFEFSNSMDMNDV